MTTQDRTMTETGAAVNDFERPATCDPRCCLCQPWCHHPDCGQYETEAWSDEYADDREGPES